MIFSQIVCSIDQIYGLQQMERFFLQIDITIQKINFLDSDSQSCLFGPAYELFLSKAPQLPHRLISENFTKIVDETKNLNIVTESLGSQEAKTFLKLLSHMSLIQNVWIFPIWTFNSKTWMAEMEISKYFGDMLQLNSQVYIFKFANEDVEIIETYRIADYIPIQVKPVDPDINIWERRKNLMGLQMKFAYIRSPNFRLLDHPSGTGDPYKIKLNSNQSHVYLHGSYAKYLQILEREMNFTPVFAEEFFYGSYNTSNNESFGMIKLLHERVVDFAINHMKLTGDRSLVADIANVEYGGYKAS